MSLQIIPKARLSWYYRKGTTEINDNVCANGIEIRECFNIFATVLTAS